MKVKFLIPMGGRDVLYEAGEEYEVSKDFGKRLVDDNIAEEVEVAKVAKKTTAKKKK